MLTMSICSLLMTCIMCIVCVLNYCSISMHKVAGHLCGRKKLDRTIAIFDSIVFLLADNF